MRLVYNLRDQDRLTTKSLGILHVSTRLLAGLASLPEIARIDVLANRSLAAALAPVASEPRCHIHFSDTPAPREWSRLLWDNWSVVRACSRLAPDWLLLPKGFSPLIRWPRCRVSAYVHDNVFGYYRRRGLRPFPRGEAWLFERMLRRTATCADLIVTNSAFTAAEFRRDYTSRCSPVRIGAPVVAIAPPSNEQERGSILLPTSAWPHKLTTRAVAWLRDWSRATGFTGKIEGFGSLPKETHWPDAPGWIHHGRVDDRTLARLEARAGTLVYFSDYEGYGLPPVEALAAGRRAIASDLPALRETLPPACLFDNGSYPSFADVLSRAIAAPPVNPVCVETSLEVASRWLRLLAP